MAKKPFLLPSDAFGPGEADPNNNVNVFDLGNAPQPRNGTPPSIERNLEGDGANIIFMTFTPGQVLRAHQTVHPIILQCLTGQLDVTTEDGNRALTPGTVMHLREMVVHEVVAPENADPHNVLLLTMLTGEKHSDSSTEDTEPDVN